MIGLSNISNMKEMKEMFQAYLLRVTEEETEEEKKNDKKIKTYIVESNIPDPRQIAHIPMNGWIDKTNDPNLLLLKVPNYLGEMIYIDCSDPRFWLFHTGRESGQVHEFIQKLVTENKSQMDFSWFSSNFLEDKCDIGKGDGFGLRYKNSFLKETIEQEERYLRSFSMLFWGGKPSEVLNGLKTNKNLASGITLARVKQVFNTEAGFVKESISREGKFTLTKGDSFDSHLLAVDKVKEEYSKLIRKIEESYRINHVSTKVGFKVSGTYSIIELKKPIEDMQIFLKKFLSCTMPFRLFGIPEMVEPDFVKVAAVDLHTFDKFNLEITSEYIRVFLYKTSCGNVLTRLMTNLQQYYDAQITLRGCDDEKLI